MFVRGFHYHCFLIFVKVKEIWGKLTQVNQSDYLSVEEVKIYLLHYKQTRFF